MIVIGSCCFWKFPVIQGDHQYLEFYFQEKSMPNQEQAQRPIDRVESWPIEVSIWRNENPDTKQVSFNATLSRSYTTTAEDGKKEYHRTDSLNKASLLVAVKALWEAHTRIEQLEAAERESEKK